MGKSNSATGVFKSCHSGKSFHQLFTLYLVVMFFVVASALVSVFWLLSLQYQQNQTLLSEQLAPTQLQLLEQKYLINSNELLEKLLNKANVTDLKSLLNQLLEQNRQLILLNTEQKSTYEQWVLNNKAAINFLSDVEAKHPNNELLKSNMLILLDTLIDAIDIELKYGEVLKQQKQRLNKAQNQLMAIALKLESLNLQSTFSDLLTLSKDVKALFVEDYSKQLANQNRVSDNVEEIIKDFLRLEDLTVKRGILSRWEQQLSIINSYQVNTIEQQEALTKMLVTLANTSTVSAVIPHMELLKLLEPNWILVSFFCVLLTVISLLLLIRFKIKKATQFNITGIINAINGNSPFVDSANNIPNSYSKEFCQLVDEIKDVKGKTFTESQYSSLLKENIALKEQVEKSEIAIEQRNNELKNVKTKKTSKVHIEQDTISSNKTKELENHSFALETTSKESILMLPEHESSFDMERYIKHQGSVEVALFMLEEYMDDNSVLAKKITTAFYQNNMKEFNSSIQRLQINSDILGADSLAEICQCWQALLLTDEWDSGDKVQADLLANTQQAVDDLSQCVNEVV